MKIAVTHNHLNAKEFLIARKETQYAEIINCITSVDANHLLKISGDRQNLGKVYFSQEGLNIAIEQNFLKYKWLPDKEYYNVKIDDAKSIRTHNQVDFLKDSIAVEVQFGKYFSVSYDLHVKHSYYYSTHKIDVLVEIIPTKAMEKHMDTGVSWFEKEVHNLTRLGGSDPAVPVLIIGIESEDIISSDPVEYQDSMLLDIIKRMKSETLNTLRSNINQALGGNMRAAKKARVDKISGCLTFLDRQLQE